MNEDALVVGQSEFAGQTTVHPLGLLAVAVLGLCLLFLPRRWSVLPMLVMACFVSSAQRIVIASLDFDFLRIMVLFGAMRLILRKEYHGFVWKPLDTAMTLWTLSAMFLYVLREGSFSAVVNRLGIAFDVFGMYFLFRCLVRDWNDINTIIFGVILISIPTAVFFLIEHQTGRNLFSVFGGVKEITWIRDGRLRCQGPYSHPILAGCFWAALMPIIAVFWWKSTKDKIWAVIGLITSMVIVICCASSTPMLGVMMGVVAGFFFYLRRYMRFVRWSVLLILIALHLVMKAPVWHLVSRVSAVGGSTGWHRFHLINQAILNFGDWWLMGCSGQRIASWGIWAGDVTNQYILEGVRGGFLTLCLFVIVIVVSFREIGAMWRLQIHNPYRLALSWAMGVSLFVHCVMFIGVSYFGQIWILWYLLLATIGSLSAQAKPLTISATRQSSVIFKSKDYHNAKHRGDGNNVH